MQFSPTLPAKNTLEVMLKMKILSNRNIIAEDQKYKVMLMLSNANAKQC